MPAEEFLRSSKPLGQALLKERPAFGRHHASQSPMFATGQAVI